MARITALVVFVGCLVTLGASPARAESMIPPVCTCNQDCVNKWPYSGICVAQYGGRYCGYSGPGIPCEAGVPAPDRAPQPCTCNGDCVGSAWTGPFCAAGPYGPHCGAIGPGIPCGDGGPDRGDARPWNGPDDVPSSECVCDEDCQSSGWGSVCVSSSSWYGRRECAWSGSGNPCPVRDDYGAVRAPGDGGVAPSGGAAMPSRGCSFGGGAPDAAPSLFFFLIGAALVGLSSRPRRTRR